MAVIGVQRRFMQLGRVRLGEKGPKGEPRRLNTFRFTSASERLLRAVAEKYGGTVTAWEGAPDEGYFQVTTEATSLEIILPPTFSEQDGSPSTSYSQWFEMWSKGGCQRRCDGITESLSGEACMCDPVKRDSGATSECKIVTRVSFIIPDLPGLGVWRLDSGGWNAAVELPGTLELLAQAASEQRFIPAVLALQNRTSKQDGQTRRFVVPVIELPDVTIGQLVSGTIATNTTVALNAPAAARGKPALPTGPEPPADNGFEREGADFGTPPPLPNQDSSDRRADSRSAARGHARPVVEGGSDDQAPGMGARIPEPTTSTDDKPATAPMKKKLDVLVGQLRANEHIQTVHIWKSVAEMRNINLLLMIDILSGADENGVLHWSPLRESLTRAEARALIDRLTALDEKVAAETPVP